MAGDQETQKHPVARAALVALVIVAGLVAVIYFFSEIVALLRWLGSGASHWLTDYVPNHPSESLAIGGFAVLAFVINFVAHRKGRFKEFVFAVVLEAGLWTLFWYSVIIPPLKNLIGMDDTSMVFRDFVLYGLVVIAVMGVVFWFQELGEEIGKVFRRNK